MARGDEAVAADGASLVPLASETGYEAVPPRRETGSVRRALRGLGRWIDELSATRGVLLVVGLGFVVWILQSIAWPVIGGRDLGTYLRYYAQMWDWHAVFPQAMLGRTPVAPLVTGLTLQLGGLAIEVLMPILFVGSILCWTLAASVFGRRAAALVAATLLLYPGYGALFHQFSSDALSGAGVALWVLAAVRYSLRPTALRFALLGALVVVLVLTRPGNQVLLAFGLVPLLLGGPWPLRLGRSAAFLGVSIALLAGWASLNAVRYDDFAVARGTNVALPFYRAFVTDRIVSPDNGPASRRLARAVEQHLLTEEPYRSYGIDLDEFFSSGSGRMMEDIVSLTDRVFGWDSDYKILRDAGVEAVKRHPGAYASGVTHTVWQLLRSPAYVVLPEQPGDQASGETDSTVSATGALPTPTEGDLIPSSHQGLWTSTPENRIREVWTSPTEHHVVFSRPGDAKRAARVDAEIGRLLEGLPDRKGSATLAHRLNQVAYRFPPPALWLAVGLIAIAYRRPRNARIALALAGAGFLVILVSALGLPVAGEYAMPVVPAFALLAGVGLFGVRGGKAVSPSSELRLGSS